MITIKHTPRTDKRAQGIIGFYSCATVPADFARQLETENRELSHALQMMLAYGDSKFKSNKVAAVTEAEAVLKAVKEGAK